MIKIAQNTKTKTNNFQINPAKKQIKSSVIFCNNTNHLCSFQKHLSFPKRMFLVSKMEIQDEKLPGQLSEHLIYC